MALIGDRKVLVSGAVAEKPSRLVASHEPIELLGPPPRFVGRGGEKLAAALLRFGIDATGRRALDAGASTGGFTDCLLRAGAATVYAIDVGHGQLAARLRTDDRVVNLERTDVRSVTLRTVGGLPVDLVTADLSFISLRRVVHVLVGEVAAPGAALVALVKPQFEAERTEAGRGRGVIRDPAVHRRVLDEVATALTGAGADIMGAMRSPLLGASGNVEFLLHARAHARDRTAGQRVGAGDATERPARTGTEVGALLDAAFAGTADSGAGG